MKTLCIGFMMLCMVPVTATAAAPINAGFVHGLWYAREPVLEGVPNRIYVAFRNNTDGDLTGTVHFLVDDTRIGSSEFNALSGRVVEAWVDWTPSYGSHTVTASVDDAVLHSVGGETKGLDISSLAVEDTRLVDRDTDTDGIGDAEDRDDDNDTVSDEDERQRGSDPRVPNPNPSYTAPVAAPQPSGEPRGLERFVDGSVTGSVLGAFTKGITGAHHAVDAYRAKRNATLSDALLPGSTAEDGAGITRSKIEAAEGNLWQKFVLGIGALLSHLWTFLLWLLSNVLAHPLLVQLGLLIGILYFLFRTARRFGKRSPF